MGRLVLISFIGHMVACVFLVVMSLVNPAFRRIKFPTTFTRVYMVEKKPPPPVKTVKPTPTKSPGKKVTPKPVRKTPKPTPTKRPVVRKTKTPSPKQKTSTPRPRTPVPTVRRTQRPPATPTPSPDKRNVGGLQGTDIDLPSYFIDRARNIIGQNFRIPRHLRGTQRTCTMGFSVARNGKIDNIRVLRSSGDKRLDQLAYDALKNTDSLPYLPDTIRRRSIDVTVTFDFSE